MNQPEQIVRTLDRHLSRPTRLIIYGRAALALGYPEPLPAFRATMDVDAILPEVEMSSIEEDHSFWEAIEKSNHELEPTGLYLTHLFTDSQVILSPGWLEDIASIPLDHLRHLKIYRPSTSDLILTKMMRIDPQDRSDIEFLLKQADFHKESFLAALDGARIPDIPEILEAFLYHKMWLKTLLQA